jgi:deazaflavin-dependent oxidoreductase (nitroreductase family)
MDFTKIGNTGTDAERLLARWASEPFVYLTTVGRRSGRPHRIEIWFAARGRRMYLMSGDRDQADWVRNLQANPGVTVELGGETHAGVARILEPRERDDQLARELLLAKYGDAEDDLDEWGRTALPVVIDFPAVAN